MWKNIFLDKFNELNLKFQPLLIPFENFVAHEDKH